MRWNLLGVVSAALAFSSLALPWWVLTVTSDIYTYGLGTIKFYPWGVTGGWAAMEGYALALYSALILMPISGILGLAGVLRTKNSGRGFMLESAVAAILGVAVFAFGMQSFITHVFINVDSLYYSGEYAKGYGATAYLALGFWLAVVSAGIAFLAYLLYPRTAKAASKEPAG